MTKQVVALKDDLEPGEVLKLELDNDAGELVEISFVRSDSGDYYAIGDTCTHGQVSLSEGEVDGETIECWLHGSTFDLRTGWPITLPATQPVPIYPVSFEDDKILVDIDAPEITEKPA